MRHPCGRPAVLNRPHAAAGSLRCRAGSGEASKVGAIAQIAGFHHVSLPATDAERSADWYERVFGFECVLVQEEEDRVKAVMLEHPAGMLLSVHQSPDLVTRWYGSPGAPA